MTLPLVSIISVNYNEPEETIEFLDSLYNSNYNNFETIIVDNGSKRKINKNIESKYNDLTCIIHDVNLGFAGGNNLGINISKGDYIIFLNNDTLIPFDFISKMVSFMIKNPQAGACSPKINFLDSTIQYAGSSMLNPLTGRGKRIGLNEEDNGQYNSNYETSLIHGAAMIIPKKVIDLVGVMSEDYFLYYEELDWCLRIKQYGFKTYFIGETNIVHKESISVGIDSPLKVYYMSRNRILFQRRNTHGVSKIISILFYCIFALPKLTFRYAIARKDRQLKNLWRGVFWHLNKKYVFKG